MKPGLNSDLNFVMKSRVKRLLPKLIDHDHFWDYPTGLFIELFWKHSSYFSGLSVRIFVALPVQMFVAGANKVECSMSWLLGASEILASKHDIAVLKVKQGHLKKAILVVHNFVVFYYG